MMFKDTADVGQRLGKQQYIASDEINTVVYLAQSLCKPVLAEGPAGVGKTELAKAWAAALDAPLIRLQCYEGLDESKALYEWEYAKQMLYTQLLRDTLRNVLGDVQSLAEAASRLAQEEDVFFSENFLLPRPLLKACRVRGLFAGSTERFPGQRARTGHYSRQASTDGPPDQQQHPRAERSAQASLPLPLCRLPQPGCGTRYCAPEGAGPAAGTGPAGRGRGATVAQHGPAQGPHPASARRSTGRAPWWPSTRGPSTSRP